MCVCVCVCACVCMYVCHYDLFSEILRLKKALSEDSSFVSIQHRAVYVETVSFIVASDKFVIKALLWNTWHFYTVESDMSLNSTHTMHRFVSTIAMVRQNAPQGYVIVPCLSYFTFKIMIFEYLAINTR